MNPPPLRNRDMKKPIIIKLEDHIYGGFITVVIGSWSDYAKEAKKRYKGNFDLPYPEEGSPETEAMGGYHGMMFLLKKGFDPLNDNMIWVNGKHNKVTVIACLAHELLHAGLTLMEMIGVDTTKSTGNQETITYWHTWALRECLNKMEL